MTLLKLCWGIVGFFISFAYAGCDCVGPQALEIENASIVFYQGDSPGAGYMTIRQTTLEDDQLLSVRLADQHGSRGRIELHDHVNEKIQGHDVKKMVTLATVPVPGATNNQPGVLLFGPGGKHLMVYDFPQSLKELKKITLILVFKRAGEIAVNFTVRTPLTLGLKSDSKNNCGCHDHKD